MMEGIFMFILCGVAFAAGVIAGSMFSLWREKPADPLDWTAAAYEPRHEQPRAVTRIHSADLDWEIK